MDRFIKYGLASIALAGTMPLGGCADVMGVLGEVAEGYATTSGYSSSGPCYTDANGYRSPGCYDYLFAPVGGQPFTPVVVPGTDTSSSSSSYDETTSGNAGAGNSSSSSPSTSQPTSRTCKQDNPGSSCAYVTPM